MLEYKRSSYVYLCVCVRACVCMFSSHTVGGQVQFPPTRWDQLQSLAQAGGRLQKEIEEKKEEAAQDEEERTPPPVETLILRKLFSGKD